MQPQHPLDMLTGDEIERAVAIVRSTGRLPERTLFAHVVLDEPDKDELAAVEAGRSGRPRGAGAGRARARRSTWSRRSCRVDRHGEVVEWRDGRGHATGAADDRGDRTRSSRPRSTPTTSPRWRGAGITDLDTVQIDPWPAGVFGYDAEEGRRIARCISFLRDDADRQRLRPADRGPHRALRHGRQRGDRGHRPRRHAAAAEPGELLRRGPAEPARRT